MRCPATSTWANTAGPGGLPGATPRRRSLQLLALRHHPQVEPLAEELFLIVFADSRFFIRPPIPHVEGVRYEPGTGLQVPQQLRTKLQVDIGQQEKRHHAS